MNNDKKPIVSSAFTQVDAIKHKNKHRRNEEIIYLYTTL